MPRTRLDDLQRLVGELRAGLAFIREVADRLASIDAERVRLEATESRLALEVERHRAAREAYLAKRAEVSAALRRGTLSEKRKAARTPDRAR